MIGRITATMAWLLQLLLLLSTASRPVLAFSLLLPLSYKRLPITTRFPAKINGDDAVTVTAARDTSTPFASVSGSELPQRQIRRMEKNSRLPVWPAWNGVFLWAVSQVFGANVGAQLEDKMTGRVCPNFFRYQETTPFIMLVHHCHSFWALDPLRAFQATFFPEGFPAHPHRGFITLTYFFDGGFTHRDSIGIRQSYGSYYEKHSQWLFTGAGILHEEMYNFFTKSLAPMRQELYQIWINVPAACKMKNPNIKLLGGADETPLIDNGNGSKTLVLAGSYQGQTGAAPLQSDMMILQVSLEPEASWNCDLPASFRTAFLYVRKGALQSEHGESIPTHHVVYYDDSSRRDERVTLQASEQGADFIFLAGEPINEPCAAEGSMVMNTADEINTAYADYQMGLFGKPWDHKLTDEEWRKHVASNPSRYR